MTSYNFTPARRENTSLLISLAGSSGSGKTYSAFRLATGLANGGKVAVIDTEAGRAKHYADKFAFDHCDISAPFSPDNYLNAIHAAEAGGYPVIIIDSMSHEWNGDGGVIDMQEKEVDIAVERARKNCQEKGWKFDEDKTREAQKLQAWIKPKMAHKRMMTRLLQCRSHIIFCLRAEEKTKISKVTDEQGKTKTLIQSPADRPLTERWESICEKGFLYEMTTSLLMIPSQPGVAIPIKLQEQHKFAFPSNGLITEKCGELLAQWASGGAKAEASPELLATARSIAAKGSADMKLYWASLSAKDKELLTPYTKELQGIAANAEVAV